MSDDHHRFGKQPATGSLRISPKFSRHCQSFPRLTACLATLTRIHLPSRIELSSTFLLFLTARGLLKPARMIELVRRCFAARTHEVVVHPPRHAHRVVESGRRAAVAVSLAGIDHQPHRRVASQLERLIEFQRLAGLTRVSLSPPRISSGVRELPAWNTGLRSRASCQSSQGQKRVCTS